MSDRRQHPRYILMPPLAGRALIDDLGQVEADLIDVSIEGAKMSLSVSAEAQSRLLSGEERSMAATFVRSSAAPWKFVLIHSRLTTIAAAANGGSRCVVGGRFVVAPTFAAADLKALLAARAACCAVREGAVLQVQGAANLAAVQGFVTQAVKAVGVEVKQVDLSAVRLLERDATQAWLADAARKYPALEIVAAQG